MIILTLWDGNRWVVLGGRQYEKLKSALLVLVVLIELLLVLLVVLGAHVEVEVQLLEDLQLELVQVHGVDSPRELVGLVVVVEVVLELGGQEQGHQDHLVYVEVVETEILQLEVVPVDVDYGDYQALSRVLGVLVQPLKELEQGHGGDGVGVEG